MIKLDTQKDFPLSTDKQIDKKKLERSLASSKGQQTALSGTYR